MSPVATATDVVPSSPADASPADLAVQQSAQIDRMEAAKKELSETFAAARESRKAKIRAAFHAQHVGRTAEAIALGSDCAAYIADGLRVGIKRADLVKDLCDDETSAADVTFAVKAHHLQRLVGRSIGGISWGKVKILSALLSRNSETEAYSLLHAEQSAPMVGLIIDEDCSLASREQVQAAVDGILGKVRSAAVESKPESASPTAPTAKVPESAPSVAPAPIDQSTSNRPLDCAVNAWKQLQAAGDPLEAATAFGQLLGNEVAAAGRILRGLADYCKSEKTEAAGALWRDIIKLAVAKGEELRAAGLKV